MPNRTKEHIIGDQAMNAVASLIAEAGHAVERVINDYGEDLLVQTSHAGRMDASRLWFQVKGTEHLDRYKLKQGGFSMPIDLDHALRWARSTDLVAVVLWDVRMAVGWYALPGRQMEPRESLSKGRQTRVLRFSTADSLTTETVDRLAWTSRFHHYWLLALSARYIDSDHDADEEVPPGRSQRRVLTALDFLLLLDLVERRRVSEVEEFRVREPTKRAFEKDFEGESKEDGVEMAVYGALIKTVLGRVSKIDTELGLPTALIEESVETLLGMTPFFEVMEKAKELD